MRVTIRFAADLVYDGSGQEAAIPAELDGWKSGDEHALLDRYLDADLADAGVVGGEIRVEVAEGRPEIAVDYWLPAEASREITERLEAYTLTQMSDGAGEGGIPVEAVGRRFLLIADTDRGATSETTDDGRPVPSPPAVTIAARDGDIPSLAAGIADSPGDVDRPHQGYTGLQYAALYGRTEAARLLLEAGADPNRAGPMGSTPLMGCALTRALGDDDSFRLARLLLDAGADPSRRDETGRTAKDYAEIRGKPRTAAVL